MLQLVGPDWGSEAAGEQGEDDDQPGEASRASHTDRQLKRRAQEIAFLIPEDPAEAAAVMRHLMALARWYESPTAELVPSGGVSPAPANDTGKSADENAAKLLMLLGCVSQEERQAIFGYKGASSSYAALVLRRGFLGDGFAIA